MTKSRNNVIILHTIKNYTILKWGLGRSPKRGEGGSPTFSPGTDAGRVCPKALHDAEPTKHTQPFTTGKGFQTVKKPLVNIKMGSQGRSLRQGLGAVAPVI